MLYPYNIPKIFYWILVHHTTITTAKQVVFIDTLNPFSIEISRIRESWIFMCKWMVVRLSTHIDRAFRCSFRCFLFSIYSTTYCSTIFNGFWTFHDVYRKRGSRKVSMVFFFSLSVWWYEDTYINVWQRRNLNPLLAKRRPLSVFQWK